MALTSDNLCKDSESRLTHGSLYRFGQFVLDSRRRRLSYADSPVSLTPKAFDVLLLLVQSPNRLVTKEELLQAVWGDTFVEEGNLTQYIWHLRRALGDNSEDPRLIVTIPRKGYQFTATVSVAEASDTSRQAPVQVPPTVSLRADPRPVHELPVGELVPKAPGRWRKGAVRGASALLFVVIGFASWLYFRAIARPRSGKVMLAVLPFENLTGDPSKEYLADGLTEEMISQLGRLNPEQLGVIARTSVMGYKHKEERLDQIGRDLSVQYVLENSLRASGNQVRLTAQLIQVKDQTHLWSKDYDYPAKHILTVEDDVAKAVAQEIRAHLTSQQQATLAQSLPVNPEAFDAYMQGFYFFERDTDDDTNRAAKFYERAVQLDPSYALAWVGLSRTRHWQAVRGLIPSEEGRRLAREAVERALALNPNLAAAHAQMGRIERQDNFDWVGADVSTQRAVALEPGNPENVDLAGFSAAILGRFDEALQLAHRAVDLDPLNAFTWENLGETEFLTGQLDKAVADIKKALELRPEVWNCHLFLSYIYVVQGRPQEALPEIGQMRDQSDTRLYLYALVYQALGQKKEADAALSELIAKYQAIDEYLIAEVYAIRNQRDEAFEWLDRGYARHNDGLILTKVDPLLKNLHNDPRYGTLLKKLNLPT